MIIAELTCPNCEETITVQHAAVGLWALSVDNPCEICLIAVNRLGYVIDNCDDETIHAIIEFLDQTIPEGIENN